MAADFWNLVSEATAANPFGPRRAELDEQITGTEAPTPEEVVTRIQSQLRRHRRGSPKTRSKRESPTTRLHIERARLFVAFHEFAPQLDAHLAAQQEAGATVLPFEPAAELLRHLVAAGFPESRAQRFIPIIWQMRRAYNFIDEGLLGVSRPMQRLREALWNNVFTADLALYDTWLRERMEDFSTILTGETGTGKGRAAAAIGNSGFIPWDADRGRFVESFASTFSAINLSQYPETLIESELFGHRKGAFTGAVGPHDGVLARCSAHGSIFLDEIGEVSVPVQIKLLQVLQERSFTPVGSHEAKRFSGRVIAATNRPLDEARREGRFRDDFYYRLCSDVIELPTLRERLADEPRELGLLIESLVARLLGAPAPGLVEPLTDAIQSGLPEDYPWPGNVRELEQAVRRGLLNGSYAGDHVQASPSARQRLMHAAQQGEVSATELLAAYCHLLWERHGTYEAVAKRTELDRRTVKKYVQEFSA